MNKEHIKTHKTAKALSLPSKKQWSTCSATMGATTCDYTLELWGI